MIDVLPCGPCSSLAASLSGSAAKVLIALGTAQGPDGLIALCLRSIATQSGVSRSAASAALAELIRHGLLQRVAVGGGRTATQYRLLEAAPRAHPAARQAPMAAGATRPPQREPARALGSAPQQHSSSSKSAAAECDVEDGPSKRKREALQREGICEPALSELASDPDLKVSTVTEQIERARTGGKGSGALILNLRAIAAGARSKAQRQPGHGASAVRIAAPRAAEPDERSMAFDRADAHLLAIPPAEIDLLAGEALQRLSPFLRAKVDRENGCSGPLQCRVLRHEICKLLIEKGAVPPARSAAADTG